MQRTRQVLGGWRWPLGGGVQSNKGVGVKVGLTPGRATHIPSAAQRAPLWGVAQRLVTTRQRDSRA